MGILGTKHSRLAAYGVVIDEGKILLARWTSREGPKWTLPGGGVDFGEDPFDAAIREVAEETGYVFAPDTLLGIDSFHRAGDFHGVRVIYEGRAVGGQLTFEQGGSTDMAAWIDLAELPELSTTGLLHTALALREHKPATGRATVGGRD
ncbi:NUDIX hydrolase [Actinokineospora sp. HUAS TT18]|uniref:NUDIX hydrolase n=1 Tax=Actinokineospora sp. HUAS TT18 TaxID=3447451 RepID=UPI003F5225FC